MAKKQITYEASLKELEGILSDLNKGEVSIDDLHEKVKRAKELLTICKKKLRDTEAEIESLLK